MVAKFFRNSNFSDFLGIKSEISQSSKQIFVYVSQRDVFPMGVKSYNAGFWQHRAPRVVGFRCRILDNGLLILNLSGSTQFITNGRVIYSFESLITLK